MQFFVSIAVGGSTDENEVMGLRDWLLQETPRPADVDLVAEEHQPGNMGAAWEVLQVSVGAGGALTVLAGAISTWFATRRQDLTLEFTRSDGQVLRIDGHVKDAATLISAFLEVVKDEQGGNSVQSHPSI